MPGAPDQKNGRVRIDSAPKTMAPIRARSGERCSGEAEPDTDHERGGADEADADDRVDRSLAGVGVVVGEQDLADEHGHQAEHADGVDATDQGRG